MEWFKEAGREREGGAKEKETGKKTPSPEFTLVLSPDFAHGVKSSSVICPINRPLHLHPDRDKCNDKTVLPQKWRTA